MYNPEGFSIFLEDTEPLRPIRRIRPLIDADLDFLLDYPDDLVVYSRWYGNISLYPWDVFDSQNDNRLEVIFLEVTTLGWVPCYCCFLGLDQKEHELLFFWP